MGYIVVSFYTENTPYEREVQNLKASVQKFGLRSYISGAPNLGSWEKNCQHKAEYIREAMDMFDENIVWIDADAIFQKEPVLFDTLDCDLAYHYLEYRKELLSGTLFIQNNDKMKAVVDQWIAVNKTNNLWDQVNLQKIVESHTDLNTFMLPEAYCKIFKHRVQKERDPVITHFQASRRFKRVINRGVGRRR